MKRIISDKFFFSPSPTKSTRNNYIVNFYEALSSKVKVVNFNYKPVSTAIDILRFSFKSEVMILNWIEDVIHLRFGFLQAILTCTTLLFFKASGGKIIWICHNKESHFKQFKFLARLSRKFFINISHIIIVHSSDALFEFTHSSKKKLHFLHHPIYEQKNKHVNVPLKKKIDVLIWGNITPYKGLKEFVINYKKRNSTFDVTIIGKADRIFFEELKVIANDLNITLMDEFISDEELNVYFANSNIILLPYLNSDTFSSGALVHSLISNKVVIGPSVGNFIDVNKLNACLVYKNYDDLFEMITSLLQKQSYYFETLNNLKTGIEKYNQDNSWDNFIDEFLKILKNNLK